VSDSSTKRPFSTSTKRAAELRELLQYTQQNSYRRLSLEMSKCVTILAGGKYG